MGDIAALVEQSKSGDAAAFDKLVRLYKDKIFSYVCRMTGNPLEAEDLTQEVFVRVFRSVAKFRGASSFQTWLYRIASNLCVDALRRRRREERDARDPGLERNAREGRGDNRVAGRSASSSQQPVGEAAQRGRAVRSPGPIVRGDLGGAGLSGGDG